MLQLYWREKCPRNYQMKIKVFQEESKEIRRLNQLIKNLK
jgi:hypothetical protein